MIPLINELCRVRIDKPEKLFFFREGYLNANSPDVAVI